MYDLQIFFKSLGYLFPYIGRIDIQKSLILMMSNLSTVLWLPIIFYITFKLGNDI